MLTNSDQEWHMYNLYIFIRIHLQLLLFCTQIVLFYHIHFPRQTKIDDKTVFDLKKKKTHIFFLFKKWHVMMDDFLRQCVDNRVFRAFYTLPPLKNNEELMSRNTLRHLTTQFLQRKLWNNFIYYKYEFGG